MTRTPMRVLAAAAGLSAALALGTATSASAATATPDVAGRPAAAAQVATHAKDPFKHKSAAEVLALSVKAVKGASTVRLKAHVDDSELTDFELILAQDRASGTISGPGGKLSIIRVKADLYLKGDKKFYVSSGVDRRKAGMLAGRWIQVKGGAGEIRELWVLTSLQYWTKALKQFPAAEKVPGKVIKDFPTIGLKSADGKETLFVASKGTPYPLQLEDSSGGVLKFRDWNKDVTIKRPKDAITARL